MFARFYRCFFMIKIMPEEKFQEFIKIDAESDMGILLHLNKRKQHGSQPSRATRRTGERT